MCCPDRTAPRTVSKAAISLYVLASCCLYSVAVLSEEIAKIDIRYKQGVYQLRLEMLLDAPVNAIRHVITDYAHIYRLNPAIVESEIIATPDNSIVRVKTLINDCFWIFCRDILRVEDVRELETGNIHAEIVPELSSITSGTTIWRIQPLGRRTRINYNMILEPGFVVPPLIGSFIIKRKLRKEVLVSLGNIERIAQIHDSRGEAAERAPPQSPLNPVFRERGSAD